MVAKILIIMLFLSSFASDIKTVYTHGDILSIKRGKVRVKIHIGADTYMERFNMKYMSAKFDKIELKIIFYPHLIIPSRFKLMYYKDNRKIKSKKYNSKRIRRMYEGIGP